MFFRSPSPFTRCLGCGYCSRHDSSTTRVRSLNHFIATNGVHSITLTACHLRRNSIIAQHMAAALTCRRIDEAVQRIKEGHQNEADMGVLGAAANDPKWSVYVGYHPSPEEPCIDRHRAGQRRLSRATARVESPTRRNQQRASRHCTGAFRDDCAGYLVVT